jgi:uncharacterized Fe-S cluster-containing radical SAM superfamily protein
MCDNQPGTSDDMPLETFQRLADEMREAGVEELGVFFLGESFMAPDLLVQAIDYAKNVAGFPYVFLTTNGALATPDRVRQCMQAGLNSLKFSINADGPEQFEKLMGVSAKNYEQALNNLQAARMVRDDGGHDCGIYASYIMLDGEQGERMEALLDERVRPYCDEVYALPLYSFGAFATQREEELGYRPIAGNQGRYDNPVEPLPCWSAWEGHIGYTDGRPYLTAIGYTDGRPYLTACCFDASSRWEMADLSRMTFAEGWNSPQFQDLRAAHLKKDVTGTICEDCVAYA